MKPLHFLTLYLSMICFNINMAVFSVVVPCRLVEVYRRFRGTCYIHHQGDRPDDEGSKNFWNVGELLPDYTVQKPRRQPSLYSPPLEPQIPIVLILFFHLRDFFLSGLSNKISYLFLISPMHVTYSAHLIFLVFATRIILVEITN
jgi:hypothetical protein